MFTVEAMRQVNDEIQRQLRADKSKSTRFITVPMPRRTNCECRKPKPLLAEGAARDLGFDPAQAFMIGDKPC